MRTQRHILKQQFMWPNLLIVILLLSPSVAAQSPVQGTESRTAGRNFWLLTAVSVGLTVAEVELAQHCLHQGTCHEGEPLVPTTDCVKLYPLQLGVTAAQSCVAHRLKRKGTKAWRLPQFSLSASHAIRVGFGMRFVWNQAVLERE